MHIYAHGSIFIEFHVQMCKYVQMCMCNVLCTHAHRMLICEPSLKNVKKPFKIYAGKIGGKIRAYDGEIGLYSGKIRRPRWVYRRRFYHGG